MTSDQIFMAVAIDGQIWVALVVAFFGLLGGGAAVAVINRKKTFAEADRIQQLGHLEVVDRTLEWNKQLLAERDKLIVRIDKIEMALSKRIERLEKEIDSLEVENRDLRNRCRHLEREKEAIQLKISESKNAKKTQSESSG